MPERTLKDLLSEHVGMYALLVRIMEAVEAADPNWRDSVAEAFIWEPPIERRPLITFGDIAEIEALLTRINSEHPEQCK